MISIQATIVFDHINTYRRLGFLSFFFPFPPTLPSLFIMFLDDSHVRIFFQGVVFYGLHR